MPAARLDTDRGVRARILRLLSQGDGAVALLRELDDICVSHGDAVYEALALVDQHYRLGRIDDQYYRRLKSRASDIALGRVKPAPPSVNPPVVDRVHQPIERAPPGVVPAGAAPLRTLLAALPGRRLPLALALAVVRDIGHALASLHSQRLAHAALTIDQVLITATGTAELRDDAAQSAHGDMELREDLIALAALAYELLTGVQPFKGLTAAAARELGLRPRRPPGLNRQQWQVLERELLGTTHHGAAEPLTWVQQVVRRRAARRLPAPADFKSIPVSRRWSWRGIRNWR
jgi:hypothetical protein